ncbi:MAG: methyltransferase domain-containing protein, partial [Spirochaetes bacterium]|nr:methyltransferase domain-containing protein [Spirochaetota bacterium]
MNLSTKKQKVIENMDKLAVKRDKWIKRNNYYYKDLIKFLKYNIPKDSSILEIGCGTGYLLNNLNPKKGVGIDISSEMIRIAKENYPDLTFLQMDAENITLNEKFDFIIISDTLGYIEDIQKIFYSMKRVCHLDTRIIITHHNFLWQPLLSLAEVLRFKMPHIKLNWVNNVDIINLLLLEDFDIVKDGKRFIFPKFLPILSWFFNKYIAHLPFFNSLCLTGYIIGRPSAIRPKNNKLFSVSVIIAARNEKGNIENAVKRIPKMGKHTEIIFVEGYSTDNTLEEIKRVAKKYKNVLDIKYAVQDGKGKGDAVRKGFAMATG